MLILSIKLFTPRHSISRYNLFSFFLHNNCVVPVIPIHDDVIKWKHFPRYWPFVRGIHRWPVNSPHKGQWRGDLMFSLICAWINDWVNNREAGDLRRHLAHYDVTVMCDLNIPVVREGVIYMSNHRQTCHWHANRLDHIKTPCHWNTFRITNPFVHCYRWIPFTKVHKCSAFDRSQLPAVDI